MKSKELNMDETHRAAHKDNEWLREKVVLLLLRLTLINALETED